MLRKLLAEQTEILGPDHEDTLRTRQFLAVNLGEAGYRDEAVAILRVLLPDRRRVLGDEDPHTLRTAHMLARNLAATGETTEAVALLKEIAAARDRVLGPEHPHTVRVRRDLAGSGRNGKVMVKPMFERFTDRARRVIVLAQEEARMLNHNYIGTEHILLGLIQEGEGVAAKALESLGISLDAVRQQVEEIIGQGQQAPSGQIPFTPRAKKVLELSLREALQLGHNYIGTEHILLGLIREGDGVAAQVLVKLGADLNRVRQQVIQLLHGYQGKEPLPSLGRAGGVRRRCSPPRRCLTGWSEPHPGRARGQADPVVGRDEEIERLMQVFVRRTKNNPLLVGVPGVGKTAVVEGLAQQIVRGDVPDTFSERQIYALDLSTTAAASPSRDAFAGALEKVATEVKKRGDIILFIDDLHVLLGADDSKKSMSHRFSSHSWPGRAADDRRHDAGWVRSYLEKDAAFEDAFQPIQVGELSVLRDRRGAQGYAR